MPPVIAAIKTIFPPTEPDWQRFTRRADVVEIFPNPAAYLKLAAALVIQSHDE